MLILFPVWGVVIGDHGEEDPHTGTDYSFNKYKNGNSYGTYMFSKIQDQTELQHKLLQECSQKRENRNEMRLYSEQILRPNS